MIRGFLFLLTVSCAFAQMQRVGKYEVTLRPPADGLFAGEEMQIELRIVDASVNDPLMGAPPIIRAEVRGVVDMPSMPGMPKIEEVAHPEGVPGDYGLHPTFAHGGEYRLRLAIKAPAAEPFQVEYKLDVRDAEAGRGRKPGAKPYRLELAASPKKPKTGQTVELRLRVFPLANPSAPVPVDPTRPLTAFDVVHEKKMHLIVMHRKRAAFVHAHPELEPDGTFVWRYEFSQPGEYSLFADFAPKGAGAQVLSARIEVAGASKTPGGLVSSDTVRATVPKGPLAARKTSAFPIAVEPAEGLEPYLGAMGHLILIAADGVTYVHSHPDERAGAGKPGVIPFLVRPPKAGRYQAALEVKRNGKIEQVFFEVEAVE